ncbi:sulfide/dihydroorotate dehydrogenase-like FAD/NAD-binding protein [Mahella australiensis]|uniref:Sulfide dehydrogenase (Flavoprotein) subunit SudB n=1 Tax=Mahella australiensis (strain DSM 15567 / CIP 107919 / 50-1 BON) TaxID=697281 RepID=F4A3G3_MAHA5|nr:sulfide/dihydroorotate dehydrogenase-like FAD/NAD-binding protein [Mahella australiensis]AEE97418.1 sulfide dehydrogenase (flavoprotein) subunit SudB [Mahella australiensis 50-1 BON]
MYKILQKEKLAPSVYIMKVEAPLVARKAQPGQFIILRVYDMGERIPLTIADYDRDKGTITIVFQEVGKTTKLLAALEEGQYIQDFAGPLGKPSEFDGLKTVLAIGGGVGAAPLYPQVRRMHEMGIDVDVILGAKSKDYLILTEEIKPFCRNMYIATDDGSVGYHGFVSDVLKKLVEEDGQTYDRVIAIGPLIMMKVVSGMTKQYNIPTIVSMNPIMMDGTGMCGACRVKVGDEVKHACVDGPDFDGHLVDFDEAMRRQAFYRDEEGLALHTLEEGGQCQCH